MRHLSKQDSAVARIVRLYAIGRGISLSYASAMLSGSGDTVARLDGGMSLTCRRAERILLKASKNWPSRLPWPEDIPRPERAARD